MKLKNKVAIVTGAAVGIGREIARTLSREGAVVIVNYSKSSAEAEETAALIKEDGGIADCCQADVSSEEECRKLITYTVEKYGKIDILVNNAGITRFIPFSDMEAVQEKDWDDLYDVNVKGVFFCCREAAKHMKKGGNIITIASQAGIRPFGSSIPYSVSKAALIHLTKCLAVTLAPDIRVNCISPGVVKGTRWNDGQENFDPVENERKNASSIPLQMVAEPEDIARAVLYMSGDEARFITGTVLSVDGGKTL